MKFTSEDGRYVVIVGPDGSEEDFTYEEYLEKYGEDVVISEYWREFEALVLAASEYYFLKNSTARSTGWSEMTDFGIVDYAGRPNADTELSTRNRHRWAAMRELNEAGQQLGFRPFSERDERTLMDHLKDVGNRRWLRAEISHRSKDPDLLIDPAELITKMLLEKKNKMEAQEEDPL